MKKDRGPKRRAHFTRKAKCHDCRCDLQPGSDRAGDHRGRYRCRTCSAEYTRQQMLKGGKHILYLGAVNGFACEVTDFYGELRFHGSVISKRAVVVFGKSVTSRYYIRFIGPDGREWIGNGPGPGMYCRVRRAGGDDVAGAEEESAGFDPASRRRDAALPRPR